MSGDPRLSHFVASHIMSRLEIPKGSPSVWRVVETGSTFGYVPSFWCGVEMLLGSGAESDSYPESQTRYTDDEPIIGLSWVGCIAK